MAEENGNGKSLEMLTSYPQLCGLCGCAAAVHTPDYCKQHPKQPHGYVRADVLQCTILNSIDQRLETIGKLIFIQNKILERAFPDPKGPNAPRILKPV